MLVAPLVVASMNLLFYNIALLSVDRSVPGGSVSELSFIIIIALLP